MVDLIRKIFIKDYQNVEDEKVRAKHGEMASIMGIASNLLLVILKIWIALYLSFKTHWAVFSIAIVADAANNLSDLSSSIVTLIGFRVSQKKPDQEHPFGHQRVEYISALIVSVFVVAVGFDIFKESLSKVISHTLVDYDILSALVLGLSVFIKLWQSYFNIRIGKCIDSLALKTTAKDSLLDALTTSLVFLSALIFLSPLGWNFLDSYAGLIVSLFIIYEGIMMIKEAASPLIGEHIDSELPKTIEKMVMAHKEILGLHDLIIHSYGANKYFVTLHVEVNEKSSLINAHALIDQIEKEIETALKVAITIHIDPKPTSSPYYLQAEREALAIVNSFVPKASIHDFHFAEDKSGVTVAFDVLLPYEEAGKEKEIEEAIKEHFNPKNKDAHFDIRFDHPF